jgi:hypothetical protein
MPDKPDTLRCPCGNTADYVNLIHSGAYNPRHVADTTGWRYLFLVSGGMAWLCPACAHIAAKAAQALIVVTGAGNVELRQVGDLG